jgi:hypothetical protein
VKEVYVNHVYIAKELGNNADTLHHCEMFTITEVMRESVKHFGLGLEQLDMNLKELLTKTAAL